MIRTIQIVFDGPPGPESGRFVEVEENGKGINFGEWRDGKDGFWYLDIPVESPAPTEPRAEVDDVKIKRALFYAKMLAKEKGPNPPEEIETIISALAALRKKRGA